MFIVRSLDLFSIWTIFGPSSWTIYIMKMESSCRDKKHRIEKILHLQLFLYWENSKLKDGYLHLPNNMNTFITSDLMEDLKRSG